MIVYCPQVPTGYELGIGCAVQSYGGKLFFGLRGDALAAPDVGRLRDFLHVSFRETCRAAGAKKQDAGSEPERKQRSQPNRLQPWLLSRRRRRNLKCQLRSRRRCHVIPRPWSCPPWMPIGIRRPRPLPVFPVS